MGSTLMSWDDTDAPVLLSNTPGTLSNVLKKCLVEGYGTKLPLGFDAPFEDQATHKIVFRVKPESTENSRPFLRIDESVNIAYSEVFMFESMQDINTGVGQVPSSTDTYRYWVPAYQDASIGTPIKWYIIGDSIGFYLLIQNFKPGSSLYDHLFIVYYFGEVFCNGPTFKHNTILMQSGTIPYNYLVPKNSYTIKLLRSNLTGELGVPVSFYSCLSGTSSGMFGTVVMDTSPMYGRMLYDTIRGYKVGDTIIESSPFSVILPGAYAPLWSDKDDPYGHLGHIAPQNLPIYTDVGVDTTMMVFTLANVSANNTGILQKVGIVIGEGFRNVY